ncbi:MAG: hypothetical protein U0V73_04535 [Acidimicrobiia bacterium]
MEFLVAAIVISVVGVLVVVARHRRPTGMEHSIGEFEKGLQAIAPEHRKTPRRTARPRADRTGA